MSGNSIGELRGNLDRCEDGSISGWALDSASPDQPVYLEIIIDGVVSARTYAGLYRQDLEDAEIGRGHHAFELWLHELKKPVGAVEVRRAVDGKVLARQVMDGVGLEEDDVARRLS